MRTRRWDHGCEAAAQLLDLTVEARRLGFLIIEFGGGGRGDGIPWHALEDWIRSRSVTVADVGGPLASPALEVALCCDLVFVRPQAILRLTPPPVPPPAGVVWSLARRGRRPLARGLLDGSEIRAEEAVDLGLAEAAVDLSNELPLPDEASLPALTAARDLVRSRASGRSGLGLELATFRLLFASGDPGEGARAFLEKRRPEFDG